MQPYDGMVGAVRAGDGRRHARHAHWGRRVHTRADPPVPLPEIAAPKQRRCEDQRAEECIEGGNMIQNAAQLNVALDQLASFADTLEAMRRHSVETNSSLFPLASEAY